jgi:hypothetical protein
VLVKVAQFTKTGLTYYAVTFAYDADLVELIKQTVPSYARTWERSRKEWTVDVSHAHRLAAAMRCFGVTVLGIEEPPPPPRQPGHRGGATSWAQVLFDNLGPDRALPAYRALTKLLHPDNQASGNTALQQQLNDAYARLPGRTGQQKGSTTP